MCFVLCVMKIFVFVVVVVGVFFVFNVIGFNVCKFVKVVSKFI